MIRTTALRGFVSLVALAAALSGCGWGAGVSSGAPPEGSGAIVIENFVYSPIPAEVNLGQPVTVTNQDGAAHTLTVPDGIDSGNLTQGESFSFTPTEVGTLDYLCDLHQYMKGQIIVR